MDLELRLKLCEKLQEKCNEHDDLSKKFDLIANNTCLNYREKENMLIDILKEMKRLQGYQEAILDIIDGKF